MASSPEAFPPEGEHKDTEISPPPPPPPPTNDDTSTSSSGGFPSPSTSPTPHQSTPESSPPPSSSWSPPPPSPSVSPPPPSPPVSPPPSPESSPPPPPPPSPAKDEPSPSPTSFPPPPGPPPHEPSSPPPPATTPPPPPSNSTILLVPPHPPRTPATFSPPPPGALPPLKPALGNMVAGGRPPPPSNSSSDVVVISGIVVGGFALLAFVIICLMCSRKKKKQRYYMDPAHIPPPEGNEYLYEEPSKWAVSGQSMNLPPPPGFMGTSVPSPWGGPPPNMISSEFSSGTPMGMQQLPLPAAAGLSPSIGGAMSQFRYEDLAAATAGFSQANLLGQGGFGYVHKGVLPDTREVAVKSLKMGSGQGEREFQAEVEIISRVHHRHLVSLVGYCIANEQRLLVYEYVPNKTLEFHLHGKGKPVIDWATRLKIAVGTAKGLAYLHEDCHPRIIHRDIKAANILLDHNFEAMVADFGLAKLTCDSYTHVSTRVMGTFGYLAPEYASSGKLTEKSDVFSFGVMLLELITGRRPVDPTNRTMEDSLVDWARPLLSKALEDGNFSELVDTRLEGQHIVEEMARMLACAAASIRHSARRRPKMSQIAHALEGESSLDEWNEGIKAGQSGKKKGSSEAGNDTMAYNADMMKFRKMVMSSQEFNSSEYGTTSEYGMNPSSSSRENSREMPPKQI